MNKKNIVAGTIVAGALGLGALGVGSGLAQAKPKWEPIPPIPVPGDFVGPPGHNPWGPPGQVKKQEFLDIEGVPVPNPFYGVPPGHWDDPVMFGLPAVWLPPDIPGVTEPLGVVFNPDFGGWGVWANPEWFIPLPLN